MAILGYQMLLGPMTMAQHTVTIEVIVAWWLPIYLRTLITLCDITGMEPNTARVDYWFKKGLRTKVVATGKKEQEHDY